MESVCWGNSTVGSNPTLSAMSAQTKLAGRVLTLTTEGRQMYQIALRNHLHRLTRFPPSCQTTGDNKSVEPLLS